MCVPEKVIEREGKRTIKSPDGVLSSTAASPPPPYNQPAIIKRASKTKKIMPWFLVLQLLLLSQLCFSGCVLFFFMIVEC